MTSLKPNLVKRIERLPKPTNVAGALQPIFEAVSNSIHSTQAKFGEGTCEHGFITVTVSTDRKKEHVWATIEDNGVGLDEDNWEAFITTDTDNKIDIGGKGVGRLLWLDAFENIFIKSVFTDDGMPMLRSFDFALTQPDQIKNYKLTQAPKGSLTYFYVKFENLRSNEYFSKFPGRENFVLQHFISHFLPTFIGGKSPTVTLVLGDESHVFPKAIDEIVHQKSPQILVETEEYGKLTLTLMECDKVASSDLKGSHFVHFIAHDRTVVSQSIDSKLGLGYFGESEDRVFHGILTGAYLDKNVNQERTAFIFPDAVIERIINDVCTKHIERFLEVPLNILRDEQEQKIKKIAES